MPSPADDLSDARHWLVYARANLLHAEAGHAAGVMVEYLCFDAQQAAEKAIKAVLLKLAVRFPYHHDLAELLDLVQKASEPIPKTVRDASRLTRFAVVTRYPGFAEPIGLAEY